MTVSQNIYSFAFPIARSIIKKWESLKQERADGSITAYLDPTGTPTIGWGSISYVTVPAIRSRFGRNDVRMGDVITRAEADVLLDAEISQKATAIKAMFSTSPNVNQFAAFISLAYNAGEGFVQNSTVLSLHNQGKFADAAERWKKTAITSKGVVLNGLINRRAEESKLYIASPVTGAADVGDIIGTEISKKKR